MTPPPLMLVAPPELEYVPTLFAPDLTRGCVLERLRASEAKPERVAGVEVGLTETADETAERIASLGVRVAVVGGPFDVGAGRKLAAAFECRGVDVSGPHVLLPKIDAPAASGLPLLEPDTVVEGPSPYWLVRVDGVNDAWVEPWIETHGAERLRLLPRVDPARADRGRAGGAAWAVRLGLNAPRIARRLKELAELFPPHVGELFGWALQQHAAGLDPLEELYAGNGLAERNAALLEVLLE